MKSLSANGIQISRLLSELGQVDAHANISAPVERKAKIAAFSEARVSLQGSVVSKPSLKISVRQEGWYRVTQPELVAAGLDPRTDARLLQLFVNGQEQAINIVGARDAEFGPEAALEFYGIGLDTPSTDTRAYWLVSGATPGKRIQQVREQGAPSSAASFPYTVERKDRVIYFASLKNGDKENFFGPVITGNPVEQSLMLQRVDQSGGQAQLNVRLQGVTTSAHAVRVQLNANDVGHVFFEGQAEGVANLSVSSSLLKEGLNQIHLTSIGNSSDISLVNSVSITYRHGFIADNNALKLTSPGNQSVTIGGYSVPQARVVDVTNAGAPQELLGSVSLGKGGYSITVTPTGAGERQLLAFADQIRSPRGSNSTCRQAGDSRRTAQTS